MEQAGSHSTNWPPKPEAVQNVVIAWISCLEAIVNRLAVLALNLLGLWKAYEILRGLH